MSKLKVDNFYQFLYFDILILSHNKEGLEFLGFRFYIINNKLIMKLRVSVKRNFKRKMKLINKSKINFSISVVASYKGQLKYGNCYNLLNNILNKQFVKNF